MGIPKQSCRRNKWEKIILNNAISESKRHLGVPFYFKIFYLLSFNVLIKLQAKKYGAMGSKRLVGTITDFLPIWSASNTIRTHCAVFNLPTILHRKCSFIYFTNRCYWYFINSNYYLRYHISRKLIFQEISYSSRIYFIIVMIIYNIVCN